MTYKDTLDFAKALDKNDPLQSYREQFYIPIQKTGNPFIYLCGNSLGLAPKSTKKYLDQELEDWAKLGVEGHFHAKNPWMPYHEFLTEKMAKIVGAKPTEVVVMNTLTVNLHLMMVSFYRPTPKRHKILIEYSAFPSDQYAVKSQLKFHGYDPEDALIEMHPRAGETTLRTEDILELIQKEGAAIALIMMGGVNYYTGQFFDLKSITEAGHEQGCMVGFDLAHAAGNIPLKLHEWEVDFAVWCTYKYLNSGPGSVAGCFVNERHCEEDALPRFAGWWGHDKSTRFLMGPDFSPIPTAEGWQLSNPPILSLAAIKSSLDIFDRVGMEALREKSLNLTGYLLFLLSKLDHPKISIITPQEEKGRGCQLSIRVLDNNKTLFDKITDKGVIADWREPDVIRIAPVPLYNSYEEMFHFVRILKESLLG